MFKKINWSTSKILFLLLLIVPLLDTAFEITYSLFFLVSIYELNQKNQKFSTDFITAILPLVLLFLLGLSVSIFHPYAFGDRAKDIAYFSKPILLLYLGYAIIQKIKETTFFFKSFVFLGLAFALLHFYHFITYPNLFSTDINTLRNEIGLSDPLELLALVFLFLSFHYPKIQIFKKKRTTNWVFTILIISFLLYFSRTMWVAIFLLLITSLGYAKISLKGLKYLGLFLLLIGSFYIYLYSIEIKRDEAGISAFLYKMKIAPAEIFSPKIDLNDHAALWDHWRAYEAKMAIDQTEGIQHLIGRGFGSLIDLHFVAPLNDEGMQYISMLHNGYAMLYYKTGIFGLFIYFLFLLNLYLFTFYKKYINAYLPINHLIAALGVYLIFSSLIISGTYNLKDIYLLTLGGLFALYDKNKTKLLGERK
jgi:hypothetical protein